MTIDEAIENHRKMVETQKILYDACVLKECNKHFLRRAEEHEQLAEWLEELKVYKKNSDICPICDTYCSYLAEEFENGYNKAINDFVNACKQDILCQTFGLHANGIERIAEQLKTGGNINE